MQRNEHFLPRNNGNRSIYFQEFFSEQNSIANPSVGPLLLIVCHRCHSLLLFAAGHASVVGHGSCLSMPPFPKILDCQCRPLSKDRVTYNTFLMQRREQQI
jgi:hypothetical protein